MKKIYRKWLILCAFLFFITGTIGVTYASSNKSISQAEQDKKKLEQKKKQMEKEIKQLETEKNDVAKYIKKLDEKMSKINKDISQLNLKIQTVEETLTKTKKELKKAKKEEKKQYESMKLRIQYMYENGSQDYFSLLLEAKDFGDFLNKAEYVKKISEYDNELYDDYKKIKKKTANKEKELEEKLEELNILNEDLSYQKSTVKKLTASKNEELKKYEKSIDNANEEVSDYEKEIQRQEELIEDLLEKERQRIEEEQRKKEEERKRLEEQKRKEEEERKKKEAEKQQQKQAQKNSTPTPQVSSEPTPTAAPSSQTSGGFGWPLAVSGKITSYFGGREQPIAGASTNHKGIDIAAPQGTAVLAAASGTVVTATYSSSAGNYIMIYHGNSTYTVYMHCSSLNVGKGQTVSRGQTIASVGSTGVSSGSHLHFGISVGGSYVNPLNYVSQ